MGYSSEPTQLSINAWRATCPRARALGIYPSVARRRRIRAIPLTCTYLAYLMEREREVTIDRRRTGLGLIPTDQHDLERGDAQA